MEKESRIKRIVNGELLGRVSGPSESKFHQNREEEILSILDPAKDIKGASDDRTDRWPTRGTQTKISIEDEEERTLKIQERLDQEIVDENNGIVHHSSKGLQPCQRVGLDD